MAPLRLELQDITKVYPGARANDGISLRVSAGQIHAILGENGAGKSTLMKIIYGVTTPDSGRMRWNGNPVRVTSPEHARRLGIAMVFQHFSLFENLTVAENVWLGLRKTSKAEVAQRIREQGTRYGSSIDPDRPVYTLSVGERQRVEIVRALLANPQLLILDEPTSVLTPGATLELFSTLRRLAEDGCSVLYISHKLDEVRALSHHCTVLRAGKVTGEVSEPAKETNASLSRLMLGVEPPPLVHREGEPGRPLLEVRGLNLEKSHEHGTALTEVSFSVRAGEVLGVAGVSGSGQAELLAALSGEDRRVRQGRVLVGGDDVSSLDPGQRRRFGLRTVPEERLGRATVPEHSLAENVLLTRRDDAGRGPMLRRAPLRRLATRIMERFGVKARGADAPARSLSGGNLQKFVVGRELDAQPRVLVVSQPTWGVDVGAASLIRAELLSLRDAGSALLVMSEDLDELLELSDALVVIAGGRVSPRVSRAEASRDRLGEWMSGLWDEAGGEAR